MDFKMKISNTGYWESKEKLYHVRCEPLCDWIAHYLSDQKDNMLYDFGCGWGQYCNKLKNFGFTKIIGFEGSIPLYKEFEDIRAQDLSVPFSLSEKGNVLFLEVAEHIPDERVFMSHIKRLAKKVVISWSQSFDEGNGHVNAKKPEEAEVLFNEYGFRKNYNMSSLLRDASEVRWIKDTISFYESY